MALQHLQLHQQVYCLEELMVWGPNWGNSKYKNILKNILTVKSQHGITTSTIVQAGIAFLEAQFQLAKIFVWGIYEL